MATTTNDAERRMDEVVQRSYERADEKLERLSQRLARWIDELREQGRENEPGIEDHIEPSGARHLDSDG
jgi:hypothetical protein